MEPIILNNISDEVFLDDIKEIRNLSNSDFSKQMVELLYFKIDQPFRQWLSSIQMQDDKDAKIKEWRQFLKKAVKDEAESILEISELKVHINWHSKTSESIPSAMFRIEDTTSVLLLRAVRSAM